MPNQEGEKTHDPTPHRRREAREKGQVAKSQDLGSALLLLVAALTLLMAGGGLVHYLGEYTKGQLGGDPWITITREDVQYHWNATLFGLGRWMLPILLLVFLGAIAVNLIQVGFIFVPDKLAPDISRINPLKGLQRIFSLQGLMRLLFGLFKIAVIVAVAFYVLYDKFDQVISLAELPLLEATSFIFETLLWTAIKIGIALLILSLLDYAFQKWKHEQDLKMTTQELREEMKNLEGNPEVKMRRRQVQRQLAQSRTRQAVPTADVVVTNPTELAIAIKYDPEKMAAPIVVAKGAGVLAKQIRRLALEHGIPIIEKKPLAQALYREVEIDHPIPQDKYAAVAEILAYVYQLKGKKIPGAA